MFTSRVLFFAKKIAVEKTPKVRKTPVQPLRTVSSEMVSVLGATQIKYVDGIKKFWEYVKSNELKKTAGKNNEYIADSKIASIIGRETFTVNEVMKIVSSNLTKEE